MRCWQVKLPVATVWVNVQERSLAVVVSTVVATLDAVPATPITAGSKFAAVEERMLKLFSSPEHMNEPLDPTERQVMKTVMFQPTFV